jgi:hypothetical protein
LRADQLAVGTEAELCVQILDIEQERLRWFACPIEDAEALQKQATLAVTESI